jgi:tetratricopeptide (TPR) repeat protein
MLSFLNPLAWGRWLREFCYFWLVSLPWQRVPRAIPAMLAIVVLTVGCVIAYTGLADWRNRLVAQQFATAWQIHDFPTAEIVVRRQLSQRPKDSNLVYKLALVRDARGAPQEAVDIMKQLVAMNRNGSAARWLLENEYLKQAWDTMPEQQRAEMGSLFQLLHQESSRDLKIKQLYANYLIARGNYPLAVTLLEELATSQPVFGLQAAVFAKQIKNDVLAKHLAETTLERMEKSLLEDPTNARLSLIVTQCQVFLQRYPDASRTLESALKRTRSDEDSVLIRNSLAELYIAWIMHIEKDATTVNRLQVLQLLQLALQCAPNNGQVLMLVADKVLASLDENDQNIIDAREALIAGTSPGISHFIQGTSAMLKGNSEQAEMHLTLASQLLPKSGAILNNLAVAIASRETSDLDLALKVANAAISHTPGASPHYYETRGQILFKQQKYLQAIPDLERALSAPSLATKAHEALAECYEKLGDSDLAKKHRDAAQTQGQAS